MIHEFWPVHFDNQYDGKKKPDDQSRMMLFFDRELMIIERDGEINYPCYKDVKNQIKEWVYLFSEDDREYFLGNPNCSVEDISVDCYNLVSPRELRGARPTYEAFAGMTAFHLFSWYERAQYCGRCGHKTTLHPTLRMMECPACKNQIFPRISPAIIVAVTDGERLLLTKYANRLRGHYALVAGFVEIGETAEECVRREVMEEVGIHIKDIKYYDSQPWGYDGNLMLGFTARLDGSHKIQLDRQELSTAVWLKPEEIGEISDHSSLTREMIRRFKKGELF